MNNTGEENVRKEEEHLIHLAQNGNPFALEELARRYRPMVIGLSHRFYLGANALLQREELIQSGYLGLLTSIAHYNPEKETALGTYALPWIVGEMKRAIKHAVNQTGSYEQLAKLRRVQSDYEKQHGRSPTIDEISKTCHMPHWQIACLLNEASAGQYSEESEGGFREAGRLSEEQNPYRHVEMKLALDALTREERQVILLRYYRDQSQSETAKTIGKSQAQVSRIERRAVEHLKVMLT